MSSVFNRLSLVLMSMSSLQYTICSFQEYVLGCVKLSPFLQYLPKYSLLSSTLLLNTLNKVVWTWKDDWPARRTSTYERPFTRGGNYLVFLRAKLVLGKVWWFGMRSPPWSLDPGSKSRCLEINTGLSGETSGSCIDEESSPREAPLCSFYSYRWFASRLARLLVLGFFITFNGFVAP